jgi:transposase
MNREQIKAVYDRGPEAVIDLVEQLFGIIREQQAQIADLTARVKELEDRLTTDSHHSSQPPSSDLSKKKTQRLRQSSGKKPGAQRGHTGHTWQSVATPDQVMIHALAQCQVCGVELGAVPADEYECRQVFDLPPLKLDVTEHRAELKSCPSCGATGTARFPAGVTNEVQYGAGINALGLYLMNYHLLPYRRTREILQDLFGQGVARAPAGASGGLGG